MSSTHRTAPDHDLKGWPSGVKYIVGNEGAERFSFYGMKAILYIYLTHLIQVTGIAEQAAQSEAFSNVHLFIAGVYAFPVLGALLADKLIGKYNTILWLSMVYVGGHAAMAIFDGNLEGTYLGLALIGVGAGGIKPCVSAHVGDQFGKSNWHLIGKVFQLFYFMINFGSMIATIAVPWLYDEYGAMVAFGVPGIAMFLATVMFWMGRKEFVHLPADPGGKLGLLDVISGFLLFVPLFMLLFAKKAGIDSLAVKLASSALAVAASVAVFNYRQRIKEDDGFLAVLLYCIKAKLSAKGHEIGSTSHPESGGAISKHWFFGVASAKFGAKAAEGPLAVFRIISVFFLVSFFWMLFDQHATTWVEQAKQLDRDLGFWYVKESQVSAMNPMMVMILIPLLGWGVFPLVERMGITITPLRKMSAGMILAGTAFIAVAIIQARIEATGPGQVSIGWQVIPYLIMTLSEVLVSVTGLEFAYTQAPPRMKSIVMSFWLLCVAFGNWGASLLTHEWKDWPLSKAFWAFAMLMFAAGVLFSFRAIFYTYKEYPQE